LLFKDLNIQPELVSAIEAMNFIKASPIQEKAIPVILEGKDILASAQTGTGKTAAFLIPLLDLIVRQPNHHVSVLVLVPTRELAKQIDEQIEGLGYFVGANSLAIYGGGKGENWDQQRTALTEGADIIIATPGRLIAHMASGKVSFEHLKCLVLDEADKMLDMGFADDITQIIKKLPPVRQNLMFSATMPPKIRKFAHNILNHPIEINLAVSKPAEGISQLFFMAADHQKLPLLVHLLKEKNPATAIIFSSKKIMINSIIRGLSKEKLPAKGVSSDIEQEEREEILRGFKNNKFRILVATDVLSRGIDINNLSMVINFDVPRDAEDYIHRIGRTARAETTGTSITFINTDDQRKVLDIERLLEREVEKLSITEELGLGAAPVFNAQKRSGNFNPKNKKKFFNKKPKSNLG
jgi:superfamily II DNA/RNA helicase